MDVAQIMALSPEKVAGSLTSVVDSLIIDAGGDCWDPKIISVDGDIYAIVYQDAADSGQLVTLEIDSVGNIAAAATDTAAFAAATTGQHQDIIHISGTVYAIVYSGSGVDGYVLTINIANDGTIGALIDSLEFDTNLGSQQLIYHVSGTTYAIAYYGGATGAQGAQVVTVDIANDGTIGLAIIELKYITSEAPFPYPRLINVSGTMWACVYRHSDDTGKVETFTISAIGEIGATIDSLVFDATACGEPDIFNISGDIYGVAYRGVGDDGWIQTFEIASDGSIGAVIDSFEFDATYCIYPEVLAVADQTYGVFYGGSGPDGWLQMLVINAAGVIRTTLPPLEFDTTYGTQPDPIELSAGYYAVVYKSNGSNISVITIKTNT